MRSGIVNPNSLRFIRDMGSGFIVGSLLDIGAMSLLNSGLEMVGMTTTARTQRAVKKYQELTSDTDKNEYLKKINAELKKNIDYQKSSTFVLEKIITMGGITNSDRLIREYASILTNIALLSGENTLSPDIDMSSLPEASRFAFERSPSSITSGGGSDFWTLVAVAALEDSDGQSRADVAQSIYNRRASGAYGSGTIRELILDDKQYQPTWDYPRKNPKGEKANPEWFVIKDAESAAAATGKSVQFIQQAAADIQNKTYQEEARKFVGARTDFTNYPKLNRKGQIIRSSNLPNNYFGWDWNYKGDTMGGIPSFNTTTTPTTPTPTTLIQTAPQTKTFAILCYGTNDWSLPQSKITEKANKMIGDLINGGYKVVVVLPNKDLMVNGKKYSNPHKGVNSAAFRYSGIIIEKGKYDNSKDSLHLTQSEAARIRKVYQPAIYVGDSNAVRVANKKQQVKTEIKGKPITTAVTSYGGDKIQALINDITSTSPTISLNRQTVPLGEIPRNLDSPEGREYFRRLDAGELTGKKLSSIGLNQPTTYSNGGVQTREIINNMILPIRVA
jgi:hypothetical protein